MPKCSPTRRMRRGERGAAALEFALVLPLLIMLLLGTITGGMAFFQKISLADAVREGARFGAIADAAVVTDWPGVVQDRTVEAAPRVLDPAAPDVCVQLIDSSGAVHYQVGCDSAPAAAPPSSLSDACIVRVRASKAAELNIGLHAWPLNLVQDSYARYEWSC